MSSIRPIVPAPKGWTADGFEPVMRAFESGFSQGIDKGAAVSIYFKGSPVVNLWGGLADDAIKRPWKEETFGRFWSGTKYPSSVIISHLVERGLLDYGEKVSKYWPEFAQNGKETITLDNLLSHTAGLSVSKEDYQMSWLRDQPHKLSTFLASQTPLWTPGTKHGYSGFLFALYLNEIVKRVDVKARSLSQYFEEEIAEPFELDFHIGLPKHLYHKACRAAWRRISKEEIAKSMENYQGNFELFQRQYPKDMDGKRSLDDPDFAILGCGSTHGAGTAKAAAKFAGILGNGGCLDDKVMLTQEAINRMQKPLTRGPDYILSVGMTFARGVTLLTAKQGEKSWNVFGHGGFGGQMILSDCQYKMGFAYCTNYMEPFSNFENNRWRHLLDAFYQCASQIEGLGGKENPVMLYEKREELSNDDRKNNDVKSRL